MELGLSLPEAYRLNHTGLRIFVQARAGEEWGIG